jgi:hypothetical protein
MTTTQAVQATKDSVAATSSLPSDPNGLSRSGNVTESIYSDGDNIIPLAEVIYIERRNQADLMVVMKGTTWNGDLDCYNNAVYIPAKKADGFKSAWCRYRSEMEADTLADMRPTESDGPSAPIQGEAVAATELCPNCNSHESLVAALKEAERCIEMCVGDCYELGEVRAALAGAQS